MKKKILKTASLALLLATPYVAAHSGHDHAHWTSGVIHTLWIGASLAIVALAVVMFKKRTALKAQKNQSKEG
ncbi:MAG: hypothetical protein COA83_07610 [Methylophaga sp.]|nr:MAG: hypothetical protein COA83_07610 [Methylophaga sp.]